MGVCVAKCVGIQVSCLLKNIYIIDDFITTSIWVLFYHIDLTLEAFVCQH